MEELRTEWHSNCFLNWCLDDRAKISVYNIAMPHQQWKENILTDTDRILVHVKELENYYWIADSCIQATTQTPTLCTGTDSAKKKG